MRRLVSLLLLVAALAGCTDDSENLYTKYRAFFRYSYVSTTPPLYAAVNSPGIFCTITFPAGKYHFALTDGNAFTYTPTALDAYGPPECIAGFIVGTPQVPDVYGNFTVTAYDLVCPNCYEESAIQRSLTVSEGGAAKCSRCLRTYDLNNNGIMTSGPASGRKLFRYHVAYAATQGVLMIQN